MFLRLRHSVILFSIALMSSASVWAQTAQSAFGPGEETRYQVSWLGLVAGKASVTVGWETERFGRKVLPLVCVGETASVGAVFPVKDRFVSYFDTQRQTAVGAEFFVSEGRSRRRERYQFEGESALVERQVAGREKTESQYSVAAETLDLAAAAFRLRNLTLSEGQMHDMSIFTGDKTYLLHAVVEGKEVIRNALGTNEAWRVRINTDFSGQLKTQRDIVFFLTTDERHLPIRAYADFLLGSVVLDAVQYESGLPLKR
jgi:hypothetical protein